MLNYITLHVIMMYNIIKLWYHRVTLHCVTVICVIVICTLPKINITSHYITLHHTTSHYITLHYITSHYITLHCTTSHYITLHCITLHYITPHYITINDSLLFHHFYLYSAYKSFYIVDKHFGLKLMKINPQDIMYQSGDHEITLHWYLTIWGFANFGYKEYTLLLKMNHNNSRHQHMTYWTTFLFWLSVQT